MVNRNLQFFISFFIICLSALFYSYPNLSGDKLFQHDYGQTYALEKETVDYKSRTGRKPLWSNRNFGGVPNVFINHEFPFNVCQKILHIAESLLGKHTFIILLLMGLSFFTMHILGHTVWICLLASIAFGLSTSNIGNLAFGSLDTLKTLAFSVLVIGSTYSLLNSNRLKTMILLSLASAFMWASADFQITYYTLLIVFVFMVFYIIDQFQKENAIRSFSPLKKLILALFIGLLPNISLLWHSSSAGQEMEWGDAVLEEQSDGYQKSEAVENSTSLSEALTYIIPRFKGGTYSEYLGKFSNSYQYAKSIGFKINELTKAYINMPLYWGSKGVSKGPAYIGIIFFTLFIISLFFVDRKMLILLLSIIIGTTILSFGDRVPIIFDTFFFVIPFFKNFSSHDEILLVTNFFMIWLMAEGLQKIQVPEFKTEAFGRGFRNSILILLGITLFFTLASSYVFDFRANYGKEETGISVDENLEDQYIKWTDDKTFGKEVMRNLRKDREALLKYDSGRSFILILATVFLLLLYKRNYMKLEVFLCLLGVIGFWDLAQVNQRYLGKNRFISSEQFNKVVQPDSADYSILNQISPSDRILDITRKYDDDARPNLHYNNVGGKRPAKLKRYSDVEKVYLNGEAYYVLIGKRSGATPILNLFNTRFLKRGSGPNQYLNNVTSVGSAWFANKIIWVKSHREELEALDDLETIGTAVIHREFVDYLKGYNPSDGSFEKVILETYDPDYIKYMVSTSRESLLIFSEPWFKANIDWKVKLNGEKSHFIRANYLFRAMLIPQGKHMIEFEYKPKAYYLGEKITLAGSILFMGLLIGGFFYKDQKTLT